MRENFIRLYSFSWFPSRKNVCARVFVCVRVSCCHIFCKKANKSSNSIIYEQEKKSFCSRSMTNMVNRLPISLSSDTISFSKTNTHAHAHTHAHALTHTYTHTRTHTHCRYDTKQTLSSYFERTRWLCFRTDNKDWINRKWFWMQQKKKYFSSCFRL